MSFMAELVLLASLLAGTGGILLLVFPVLEERARVDDRGRIRFPARIYWLLLTYGCAGVGVSTWLDGGDAWLASAVLSGCVFVPLWTGSLEFSRSTGLVKRRFWGLWRQSMRWSEVDHVATDWSGGGGGDVAPATRRVTVIGRSSGPRVFHERRYHADQDRFLDELRRLNRFRIAEAG